MGGWRRGKKIEKRGEKRGGRKKEKRGGNKKILKPGRTSTFYQVFEKVGGRGAKKGVGEMRKE